MLGSRWAKTTYWHSVGRARRREGGRVGLPNTRESEDGGVEGLVWRMRLLGETVVVALLVSVASEGITDSRGVLTGGKKFCRPEKTTTGLTLGASARVFEECYDRTASGTRTLDASRLVNGRKRFHAITLTYLHTTRGRRANERVVRGVSGSGSLTIGSGSSNPAVDTRRRECKLPAFAISTHLSANCCTYWPTISASPLPPRERPTTPAKRPT
jgi:hypothetical protein